MFEQLLSFLLATTMSMSSGASLPDQEFFDDKALLSVSPIPYQDEAFVSPPNMSAASILSIDLESQSILYERNSFARVPIASLTKLMTAYIILEENNLDSVVTVSQNAAGTLGSSMGLYAGEEIYVKDLMKGLLIKSGNDAAITLAEFNAGSVSEFVIKMNETADELGLDNTHYVNPTGLDSGAAYSSARDQALLSSYLALDPTIREIAKTTSTDVTSISGTVHHLANTNILLGQLGIIGLKTGKTPIAGECLITLSQSPDGHEVVNVILGSQNRFADTKILVDWIYRAFNWSQ